MTPSESNKRLKNKKEIKHFQVKSILFVCLGNICRSPMAEGILCDKAKKMGLWSSDHLGKLQIDSAGTEQYHIGENPDIRAIETAKKHGIDISKSVARQFKKEDFVKFDLVLVADDVVYREVMAISPNKNYKKNVDYIMNFVYPASNLPVPDPYYGGINGFERVFKMLNMACELILKSVIGH